MSVDVGLLTANALVAIGSLDLPASAKIGALEEAARTLRRCARELRRCQELEEQLELEILYGKTVG
jgi:hypothetical protein